MRSFSVALPPATTACTILLVSKHSERKYRVVWGMDLESDVGKACRTSPWRKHPGLACTTAEFLAYFKKAAQSHRNRRARLAITSSQRRLDFRFNTPPAGLTGKYTPGKSRECWCDERRGGDMTGSRRHIGRTVVNKRSCQR